MYEINRTKKFKTAHKKLSRSGNFDTDEFENIVYWLAQGISLPAKYRDHSLTGDLLGKRECHIRSDLLLLYEIDIQNKTLTFLKVGNHAQLFGQ